MRSACREHFFSPDAAIEHRIRLQGRKRIPSLALSKAARSVGRGDCHRQRFTEPPGNTHRSISKF